MDSTRTCEHCSEEYQPNHANAGKQRFCSKGCWQRAKRVRITQGRWKDAPPTYCIQCGVELTPHPRSEVGRLKYCSPRCERAFERGQLDKKTDIPAEKECTHCGKVKPIGAFQRSGSCTDGHIGTCYACVDRAKRNLRLAGVVIERSVKRCPSCATTFPATHEYWTASTRNADGWVSQCKSCVNRRSRAYQRSITPEERRARYNPEPNRQRRLQVLQHYGGLLPSCACCGEHRLEFLSIDHVNGDGTAHRRTIRRQIYVWLVSHDFPEGFQILCHGCNLMKRNKPQCPHALSDFETVLSGGALWRMRYHLEIKRLVMEHYGNGTAECACCGANDLRFLCIDHIGGWGAEHRRAIGPKGGLTFYLWLRKHGFPEGLRPLCLNCNSALGNYGYCPHDKERGRTKTPSLLTSTG